MKITGALLIFVPLFSIAASAQSGGDALSAMQNCTSIADDAMRLACYDKAAGRAPIATPAQAAPLPASALAASVAPPAPPPVPPQKTDLENFIGNMFPDGASRAPQTKAAQFGSESISSRGEVSSSHHMAGDTVDAISARVVAYSFMPGGRLVLSLDNGQIWIQAAGDESIGSLSDPAESYTVQIDRNSSSGSYDLHLSGHSHLMRFRRVR